jgi:general secretion pathway protein G
MFGISKNRGFTLVELLIVVLILAALAAIAVPRMVASADTAKINACNTNVDLINTQIELYRASNGSLPTLTALFADTNYFPDGAPVCPFGTAYALGANGHVTPHSH